MPASGNRKRRPPISAARGERSGGAGASSGLNGTRRRSAYSALPAKKQAISRANVVASTPDAARRSSASSASPASPAASSSALTKLHRAPTREPTQRDDAVAEDLVAQRPQRRVQLVRHGVVREQQGRREVAVERDAAEVRPRARATRGTRTAARGGERPDDEGAEHERGHQRRHQAQRALHGEAAQVGIAVPALRDQEPAQDEECLHREAAGIDLTREGEHGVHGTAGEGVAVRPDHGAREAEPQRVEVVPPPVVDRGQRRDDLGEDDVLECSNMRGMATFRHESGTFVPLPGRVDRIRGPGPSPKRRSGTPACVGGLHGAGPSTLPVRCKPPNSERRNLR